MEAAGIEPASRKTFRMIRMRNQTHSVSGSRNPLLSWVTSSIRKRAFEHGGGRRRRLARHVWEARPVDELRSERAAAVCWCAVFGLDRPSGRVTGIEREVQTMKLIARVQLGEITTAQFEQLSGFLDAERLGMTIGSTSRRRRGGGVPSHAGSRSSPAVQRYAARHRPRRAPGRPSGCLGGSVESRVAGPGRSCRRESVRPRAAVSTRLA